VICVVALESNHTADTSVDQQFAAVQAADHPRVHGTALDRDALLSGLCYCVTFCVRRSDTVKVLPTTIIENGLHEVANLVTGLATCRRTNVARRYDVAIDNDHGTVSAAVAAAAFTYCLYYF
jgi:hypothetical protein